VIDVIVQCYSRWKKTQTYKTTKHQQQQQQKR